MNIKTLFLACSLLLVLTSGAFAQVHVKTGKPLQITHEDTWDAITFTDDKKGEFSISYQLHFVKKVALGCHYELRVKNETAYSVQGNIYLKYYDNLVKRNIREQNPYKLKPNSTSSIKLMVQGCAKKNGQEEQAACLECGAELDWTYIKVK